MPSDISPELWLQGSVCFGQVMINYPRFHLAIAVVDLAKIESFTPLSLGCSIGRRAERWIDFDFYGHQNFSASR